MPQELSSESSSHVRHHMPYYWYRYVELNRHERLETFGPECRNTQKVPHLCASLPVLEARSAERNVEIYTAQPEAPPYDRLFIGTLVTIYTGKIPPTDRQALKTMPSGGATFLFGNSSPLKERRAPQVISRQRTGAPIGSN